MTDSEPTPLPVTSSVPEKQPRSWPLSRTILLLLLAVALGALGFDTFAGRMPANAAQKALADHIVTEQKAEDLPKIGRAIETLTPAQVHKLLGREPTSVETNAQKAVELMNDADAPPPKGGPDAALFKMVETYRFPGALHAYLVRVGYFKNSIEKSGDENQNLLMGGVRQLTQ